MKKLIDGLSAEWTGAGKKPAKGLHGMIRLATYGARYFLGLMWIYAAHDKILHPEAFAHSVYNYQVIPDAAINLTAIVLPWAELLIGICLLAGNWLPGASVLSSVLLTGFAATLLFNLQRGLDVHCGCFSVQASGDPANYLTVVRDLSFLAVSTFLMVRVFFYGPAAPTTGSAGKG